MLFLGYNLGDARYVVENGRAKLLYTNDLKKGVLRLDGREAKKNRMAERSSVPDGDYAVTRKVGQAPGMVAYYGEPIPEGEAVII